MERKIVLTSAFNRAYKKFIKKHPDLTDKIEEALRSLEKNPIPVHLKSHKLSGELKGLMAYTCGFDCRIIYKIEKEEKQEFVLLIDIISQDKVY